MDSIKERNGGLCTRAGVDHYSASITGGPIKVSAFGFDEIGIVLFSIKLLRNVHAISMVSRSRGPGQFVQACTTLEHLSKFISEYSHVNTQYPIVINKMYFSFSSSFFFLQARMSMNKYKVKA